MLFNLFGTPILKYTNINYQCVTSLSPKSDEDRGDILLIIYSLYSAIFFIPSKMER